MSNQDETMERLQKVLARAGLGSRRGLESVIMAGRVRVNGQVAELGMSVQPGDKITIDGRPISARKLYPQEQLVVAYHKPVGLVCTHHDPQGRPTVFDNLALPGTGRWVSVGRLDINTSGLLLLTNDGELAHRLMHPSREIEREYHVRILGQVTDIMLQTMQTGVMLDDGPAHFVCIEDQGGGNANRWYKVILKEGRNREVRRIWESQGVTVSRLIRTGYATIRLSRELRPGRFRALETNEINELMNTVGLSK